MKRTILGLAAALQLVGSGALWAAANAPLKALSDISAAAAPSKGNTSRGRPGAPGADAVVPGGSHGLKARKTPPWTRLANGRFSGS